MSSCSTILNSGYTGFDSVIQVYDLDFTGLANGSSIDITVGSVERPDYFTVRIDGTPVENSGWIGFATYAGPWGATLNGPTSYFFSTITYDNTKSYSVDILIGPADPGDPTTDAYDIEVDCGPPPTPNPTPKGEGTARGSAGTTRGAEVDAATEESLKKKADEFNEK